MSKLFFRPALAAHNASPHEIPLLSIRGISDIVGFKRSTGWTQFACDAAASFTSAIIKTLPPDFFGIEDSPSLPSTTPKVKTPTLKAIAHAFARSSAPLLSKAVDHPDRIPRQESNTLQQLLSTGDSKVVCVLGDPGSGKTALLAHVAEEAIRSGISTLAIKADLLPPDLAFESWSQRELGLNITAIDAVKVASSRTRVLVIVDQLDALASTVDLTSDRLNAVIDFILRCLSLPDVFVICSCRYFDFQHDTRFASLKANVVDLTLPSWNDVAVQLERRGVTNSATWPEPFRELLRTPQHLQVYLQRFKATGKTDPFGSYQHMLDDLWSRSIQNSKERDLVYRLTQHLVENETLWAPLVCFEEENETIAALDARQFLLTQDLRVGFRHQTVLEHAKARLFTKLDASFSGYVLERQEAIFVRPTVWAVLRYLREAHPHKYRAELETLFGANLRLHLRYLLIEFLGQLSPLAEYEVAILANCLQDDDRLRVLIAIRGNVDWFNAFRSSQFPAVMRGPVDQQWPMLGVIVDGWHIDREACLSLIERNWLPDPQKDQLTWRAMSKIGHWDERTVETVCTLIRRADKSEDRLYWAENLVYLISADQPTMAPRVFVETVSRATGDVSRDASQDRLSPLESSRTWYELPAVAEAAPVEFLQAAWQWLVRTCERDHSGYVSTVIYHYGGSCTSLDDEDIKPHAPILSAFFAAIDGTAEKEPDAFRDITKPSWSSDNEVVHRFIIRGLIRTAGARPQTGLEYLRGDRRRLQLGSFESREQSDSIELIQAIAPRLDELRLRQLESIILSWSMYRDDLDLSEEQKEWDREARLRLLAALPENLVSPETLQLVRSEKGALPNWDDRRTGPRSGWVRQVPPIDKDAMLIATDEEILAAISASRTADHSAHAWIEAERGWEEPGGPYSAGREVAELATNHPQRAIEIIKGLVANGDEEAATAALHGLSETALTDDDVFAFVRGLGILAPRSEELRSEVGHLLYQRCKSGVGLPDDICSLLEHWLSSAWTSRPESSDVADEEKDNEAGPVLWSNNFGLLDTDRSFWPLLALTNGYLMRSPPASGLWLGAIDSHLDRDVSERTWSAYCSELRWIRMQGCDRVRGAAIVAKLFERFPGLTFRKAGIRLIAHVSDLLAPAHLKLLLQSLRTSASLAARQAFGELLTLIALRDLNHAWAAESLNGQLTAIKHDVEQEEAIAVGIAFAASHLWDEPQIREETSRILCQLIPVATKKIGRAIAAVFWARDDFAADESTEALLQAVSEHPAVLAGLVISDLVGHLVSLMPHKRTLVLRVCKAILTERQENDLFEVGPHFVNIALTLQRFPDTRADGLSLLEHLLKLGLDDAFRVLRDIDIRPHTAIAREPRRRRRRQRPNDS